MREGKPIGVMVTLRGDRMYEFLDRLVNIALPRVRDFRGVPTKSFDGRGNFTLGVSDQLIFPEIDYSKVEKMKGMNITIVTTAGNDDHARALLKHMGMPFRPQVSRPKSPVRRANECRPHVRTGSGVTEHRVPQGRSKGNDGENIQHRQGEQEAQVFDPAAQPLQALRTSARVPAQVRSVPSCFRGLALKGEIPGVSQVVLVGNAAASGGQSAAQAGTWFRGRLNDGESTSRQVLSTDPGNARQPHGWCVLRTRQQADTESERATKSGDMSMSLTDPVADFLTRVRNGINARHQKVDVPLTKLKVEIARILKEEGYIANYKATEEEGRSCCACT